PLQLRFDLAVMRHAESERPRTARKSSHLQTKIPLPSGISAPGESPEKRESFAVSRGTFPWKERMRAQEFCLLEKRNSALQSAAPDFGLPNFLISASNRAFAAEVLWSRERVVGCAGANPHRLRFSPLSRAH